MSRLLAKCSRSTISWARLPSGSTKLITSSKIDAIDLLTDSKFSWFGAVRDAANLHGVNPLNRLMDEHGELTAL